MDIDLADKHILILGWPVVPAQKWLENYSYIDANRIYREHHNCREKRHKDLTFHTPRFIREHFSKLSPEYWYGAWKEHIAEYDTVIIIDEIRGSDIFEYILKQNPKCNLCVFYDSPIRRGSTRDPRRYTNLPVRFFTCDPKISEDYGIEWHPYFYIFQPDDSAEQPDQPIEPVDVFFVGEEKGDRAKVISDLSRQFNEQGISNRLVLVTRNRHGKDDGNRVAYMPYKQVVENVKQCKAILELISNGQSGITQRPYEAMYYGKKLITNNREVMRYKFYDSQQFFVLDDRPISELKDFLEASDSMLTKSQHSYTFEKWIKGFMKCF